MFDLFFKANIKSEESTFQMRIFENNFEATKIWSNKIKTSKYTIWNFIPKNIAFQFRNFANIYFLCVCILQCFPQISYTGGAPLTLIPLSFVLLTTAAKDATNDIKMHRSDEIENTRRTLRLKKVSATNDQRPSTSSRASSSNRLEDLREEEEVEVINWDQVNVGDVLKVKRGELFPADMILLLSSDKSGSAFVETKGLDGETNLKSKFAHPSLSFLKNGYDCCGLRGTVSFEKPCTDLYNFQGSLHLDSNDVHVPLTCENFLLRGSSLQSTQFLYGVVVYPGHRSRVFMNLEGGSGIYKMTTLMNAYSAEVFWLFLVQLFICTACAVAADIYASTRNDWFLRADADRLSGSEIASFGTQVFFTLFLQFSSFVPISVLVCLQLIKIIQVAVIDHDAAMVFEGMKASVNNGSLVEELGVISHIFSDKTGTLTENRMLFSSLWVHGFAPEIGKASSALKCSPKDSHVSSDFDYFAFCAAVGELDAVEKQRVRDLLIVLGLCHSVLLKTREGTDKIAVRVYPNPETLAEEPDSDDIFDSSSPDELALVAGARYIGFEFFARPSVSKVVLKVTSDFGRSILNPNSYSKFIGEHELLFDLLDVLEFDNDRKLMSILVRLTHSSIDIPGWPTNVPILLIKGADSSMAKILKGSIPPSLPSVLDLLASEGLRTLVFGRRIFKSESEKAWLAEWKEKYAAARNMIGPLRKKETRRCITLMETEIDLLGCTGIEDKLQEGVPKSVKQLHSAGIKLWILTGDKIETAINIGYACHLLDSSVHNEIIDKTDPVSIWHSITKCRNISKFIGQLDDSDGWNENAETELRNRGFNHSQPGSHFDIGMAEQLDFSDIQDSENEIKHIAITISGDALAVILHHNELRSDFFRFALNNCKSVIACRVNPKQKADLVIFSRAYLNDSTCLAIGDGANDVGMIVAASVGVGISGNEGHQAVRIADFALSQFRFLERLLFLHGRENIRRNSQFVYFSIFRSLVYCLPVLEFAFLSEFTGTNLYNPILRELLNVIFVTLPGIFYAALDQELPPGLLTRAPFLYKSQHNLMGLRVLAKWFCFALWVSASVTYSISYGLGPYPVTIGGYGTISPTGMGSMMFFLIVLLINNYIYKMSCSLFVITHFVIWTSISAFVAAWAIISAQKNTDIFHTFTHILFTARGWGAIILAISLAFLPLIMRHVFLALIKPSNARIARERVYLNGEAVVVRTLPSRVLGAPTSRFGSMKRASEELFDDSSDIFSGRTTHGGYAFSEAPGVDRIGIYKSHIENDMDETETVLSAFKAFRTRDSLISSASPTFSRRV